MEELPSQQLIAETSLWPTAGLTEALHISSSKREVKHSDSLASDTGRQDL